MCEQQCPCKHPHNLGTPFRWLPTACDSFHSMRLFTRQQQNKFTRQQQIQPPLQVSLRYNNGTTHAHPSHKSTSTTTLLRGCEPIQEPSQCSCRHINCSAHSVWSSRPTLNMCITPSHTSATPSHAIYDLILSLSLPPNDDCVNHLVTHCLSFTAA
jgi:hypothetical protein